MSQWRCPLCGKRNSVRKYNPYDFVDDIRIIQTRGKGRGKGTEVIWEESVFNLDMEDFLEFVSDRVFEIYSFLIEDEEERMKAEEQEELVDELLQDINVEIRRQHPQGFNNLVDASTALLELFRDLREESGDEDDEMYDPAVSKRRELGEMSELDRQLAIADEELGFDDTPR